MAATAQTTWVFFTPQSSSSCTDVTPVRREVKHTTAVATTALNELFKGPTADEEAQGLTSFFDADTAGLLQSIRVEDAVAYVNLNDISGINNVTTSCGSSIFLSQMDATLKQFATIDEVLYAVDGDPERFYMLLGRGCPDRLLDENDNCDTSRFFR